MFRGLRYRIYVSASSVCALSTSIFSFSILPQLGAGWHVHFKTIFQLYRSGYGLGDQVDAYYDFHPHIYTCIWISGSGWRVQEFSSTYIWIGRMRSRPRRLLQVLLCTDMWPMDLNFPVFAMGVRIFRASNDVGPLFLGHGSTRILEIKRHLESESTTKIKSPDESRSTTWY